MTGHSGFATIAAMAELLPVLERWTCSEPLVSWRCDDSAAWLLLAGDMTPEQVGAAVRRLVTRDVVVDHTPSSEAVRPERAIELICAPDTLVAVSGGLLVQDGGFVAVPGCCCSLEDWREWFDVLDGGSVYTGHDVTTVVEHAGAQIRVWADVYVDDGEPIPSDAPHIEFDRAELTEMLERARLRLAGFRDRAYDWALDQAPADARRFAAAIDRGLAISAPV